MALPERRPPDFDRIGGVYVSVLEELLEVLRDRMLTVMDAHRFFEDHTRMRNRVGAANLAEALSHIGRLAESADGMSEAEQRQQVTNFEDHLRRTMMESFELVARARLGRLAQDGIYDRYHERVVPLVRRGKLPQMRPVEEVEALERETRRLMEEGRRRKHHYTWSDWEDGAQCLLKASDKADELETVMRQNVGAANDYRRNQLLVWLAVIAVVLSVGGIAVAVIVV